MNMVATIIPALDAARTLARTLNSVRGFAAEIIVADGGSSDATAPIAEKHGARVLHVSRGRGRQLAAGIAATSAPWLLLLHADTVLAPGAADAVAAFVAEPRHLACAGYFRFALDSPALRARRLERIVAWRSRALGLPYGDQGLLIARDFLAAIGGMNPLPLMEDVDLVRRIGQKRLVALGAAAVTSAARWEHEGWYLRSLRNLCCLSLYYAGIPPRLIARLYS